MASGATKVNWRLGDRLAYNAAMTHRALMLYLSGIRSFFHRLRHDLGRELTVLIASVVLFATFFYVFNDFLNVQVLSLSAAMRERGAEVAAFVVLLIAALSTARLLRNEWRGENTLKRTATYLGEDQAVVRTYLGARLATTLIIGHGLAWWVTWRWLVKPTPVQAVVAELVLLGTTLALTSLSPGKRRDDNVTATDGPALTGIKALVAWRWRQMLWRNRATRSCFLAALPFLGLIALSAWRGAPLFVSVVAAMVAGILAASSLAFQMAEDLPNAWTERGFGVSHADFVKAYLLLGLRIAGLLLVAAAVTQLALSSDVNGALKVGAVAAIPAIAAPGLLLQIDGRRPAVNILLILIAGLFLGTAVFAHWLALVLIPVLHYWALQSQAGRFYRA